ncbi:MAG: hypothetical protein R3F15_05785 [Lysobacterales bacterium]
MRYPIALACCLNLSPGLAQDLPYVNFENHPVHPLDISADGRWLAVAHTADQRVQLFDIASGLATPAGSVVVGIDPVAVRFRGNGELWVVNHISDSISIVDVEQRRVQRTLQTADEPFDVVFAAERAFVSASQVNQVQVFQLDDLSAAPQSVAIAGEDPRALAISADGQSVYAAIFESGNASTILGGGLEDSIVAIPNVVSDPRGPYGGRNPPPNAGEDFEPPLDPTATPPAVGLIVRKDDQGRWLDDNDGDWTALVSGEMAAASGRIGGWDLRDHDLAIIDAQALTVSYASGLLTTAMQLAVHPSGRVDLVGTEAHNEIRYEPNLNGRFLQVMLASVAPDGDQSRTDLNPQIVLSASGTDPITRQQALSDPRGLLWESSGQRGWIAGMGSNNVLAIDASGQRQGQPISVGEGPTGLALDEANQRLYVWNHFEASLSTIDLQQAREIERQPLFNPLPQAIRAGRRFLYDGHLTSGNGHVACASCHVDARFDRLAWDLGDPSQPPAPFDQNCVTRLGRACEDFHAMKGPMSTQTLQDIIGHEPLHWRGDRAGLEAFNPAFTGLLGADAQLSAADMQAFEDFLATIHFPPNPYREADNSLPETVPLPNHYTSGRFAMAGLPLGSGNPQRGLQLYTSGFLDAPFQCASCHTLPTGMAANGPLFTGLGGLSAGGSVLPAGPNGENHLGIVSLDGSTNVSLKVPQLRNQYDKVGFELRRSDGTAGFGYLHDGSVDSISSFLSARAFSVRSDQDVADLVALMLAFSGSDFPLAGPPLGNTAPMSRDSHAATGRQLMVGSSALADIDQFVQLAASSRLQLVVHQGAAGWQYDAAQGQFQSNAGAPPVALSALLSLASDSQPQTWTLVPAGLGTRLALDRDGDGLSDEEERRQGSDPADATSTQLRPRAGLWFNPARSGHGFDLQYSGPNLFVLWYTYEDDGSPVWYLAAGPYAPDWQAELVRFTWDPAAREPQPTTIGSLRLRFADARSASFEWQIGARSGTETVQPLTDLPGFAAPERTGAWYDPDEPGWGISVHSDDDLRVAILYFYDGDQQPRWTLGQGSNSASELLTMWSFRGFCPDCPAVPTDFVDAGSIRFDYDGARQAMVTVNSFERGQPQAPWQRGPVAIEPLSDAALRPESR